MILSPEEYSGVDTYELLSQAARGYVPLDHRLLRTILERGESVFPDFIRIFKEDRKDDHIDIDELTLQLARQLRTPAALPFLCEVARTYEYTFSDDLTEAFVELGSDAVEPLLALCAETESIYDTAFALAALGVKDPRILEILLRHMEEDPSEGAIMLGIYGDEAARPALEKAIAAAGENAELKRDLENALNDLGRTDDTQPAPFDMFPLYDAEDMPYFAALSTSDLLEFLKSPVAAYRARAIRMVTFEEMTPEIVGKVFEIARQDVDPYVRAFAWEGLEGVDEPEIRDALRQKLEDASALPEERAAALVAVVGSTDIDDRLRALINEFAESPDTRAQAVKAMWHSGDRGFEKPIVKALDDEDLEVRRQAVTAVGVFGLVGQLSRLEQCFADEPLRESALYSYALAAPSKVTPAHMRSLFQKIEDLADGLSEEESMVVGKALDDRLEANEYDAIFLDNSAWDEEGHEHGEECDCGHDHHEHPVVEEAPAPAAKVGRNDPCPCGSGKKYKKCCGQ